MAESLSSDQIERWLPAHVGWAFEDNEVRKRFQFADFRAAIAFVNRVADLAEAANHHPDITINYNRVLIALTTHDAGGVTHRDLDLAAQIEQAADSG